MIIFTVDEINHLMLILEEDRRNYHFAPLTPRYWQLTDKVVAKLCSARRRIGIKKTGGTTMAVKKKSVAKSKPTVKKGKK